MKETLFDEEGYTNCLRCEARIKLNPAPGSEAKMLRRAKVPKGLCINCAVHDFLRNTYPPNIQLAESGPGILLYPMIQEKFADLMRTGLSDAAPEEIDWQRVVDNWELPFREKVKASNTNPCSQKQLDAVAAGTKPGLGAIMESPLVKKRGEIKSFAELNELSPGLGDSLKKCLRKGGKIGDAEK